jgi:hypothetical protein
LRQRQQIYYAKRAASLAKHLHRVGGLPVRKSPENRSGPALRIDNVEPILAPALPNGKEGKRLPGKRVKRMSDMKTGSIISLTICNAQP